MPAPIHPSTHPPIHPSGHPDTGIPPHHQTAVTARSLLIAVALAILCGLWVRQAEILTLATQITESVPPIPAVAVLLVLVALNPVLRRIGPRFGLTRAEILSIYCFVAISVSMLGPGALRFWLALVSAPFYFDAPDNQMASIFRWIPGWLAVKDKKLIHDLYEGSAHGQVPWSAWAIPLVAWTAFFMALWLCMLCMVRLVEHRWIEAERLSFPIVKLPIEATGEGIGDRPFLKNPMMWTGFSLACVYNGLNILHAIFPAMPSPGKSLDLDAILTTAPWSSLRPLTLHYRPELIGFGFLVPSEILFSIWFFFLLTRLEGFIAHIFALDLPGMPFDQEQSMGAYLLLGFWLLWEVRRDLLAPFLAVFSKSHRAESKVSAWNVAGLTGGFLFLCIFCIAAGMAWWVAVAYLAIVLITALVCARVRAEAGIPLIWLFPFYQQKKILLYTLGTSAFLSGGVPATLTVFAMLTFLARGYFPAFIGYQVESLKIADEARISRFSMGMLMMLAALVGLLISYYFPLATYYAHGAQHLGGMWGWDMPVQEYSAAATAKTAPLPPDLYRTSATGAGAAVALVLLLLRRVFVGFPLHPLGYAVATAYGSLVWWSFLLVWVIKTLVLKWGGMNLYRRAIPLFLGFALGHFFAAGVVWGLIGVLWKEGANAYAVWFG